MLISALQLTFHLSVYTLSRAAPLTPANSDSAKAAGT
jgi:hypothetical protein